MVELEGKGGAERRAFPRFELSRRAPLGVDIARFGVDITPADVVDISRGGMKVKCAYPCELTNLDNCVVAFKNASMRVQPRDRAATVIRKEHGSGFCLVAVQFERALDVLNLG